MPYGNVEDSTPGQPINDSGIIQQLLNNQQSVKDLEFTLLRPVYLREGSYITRCKIHWRKPGYIVQQGDVRAAVTESHFRQIF